MGKAAVIIRTINGKVESKVQIEQANITDLSQLYTFLDLAKEKVIDQIKKIIVNTEKGS